jgi:glycosyltransferase involved in cell wall biosynthesis
VNLNLVSKSKQDQSYSILFLGSQMATGGAQKLLFDQARWFQSQGHIVVGAFFYDRDGLQSEWTQKAGFPLLNLEVYERGISMSHGMFNLFRGVLRLLKLLGSKHFDVMVTFTHDSNLLGLPLGWLAGVPVRIATHLGAIRGLPRWREKLHARLINSGVADVLIAASTKTRQNAIDEGVRPDRIEIVPNGITPFDLTLIDRKRVRSNLGLKDDDLLILSVGRLVYEKGQEFLIEAMHIVGSQFPHSHLVICGEGPLRKQLEAQIERLDVSRFVKLLGQWDNVAELLAIADIFILPSRSEGLPMALLEAMAAGLPVVATRVEGIEEVVGEGKHGLLVPPANSAALAKAILQLLGNPQLRRWMSAASQQRIQEFHTTERMCKGYLQIMLKCHDRKNLRKK